MTVLVLALVAVLIILVLPLFRLAAVIVAISLMVHAVLGITAWMVGDQFLVAALIFAGATLAGVYYYAIGQSTDERRDHAVPEMTRLLLTAVAALVVLSAAAFAEVARPIDKDGHSYAGPNAPFDTESAHCADQAATLDRNAMTCVPPAPAPRAVDHSALDPNWGLTANEKSCLFAAAGNDHKADFQRRTLPGATAPLIPDPIDRCNIPDDRFPKAMDLLFKPYVENRDAPTWIKAHCHDEAAMPRNKWICSYGDVTREYR